ncbi:MAG: PadR family transcriptional regulator [Actinomycetia bacterium]|nr:PadR family transcriptional regulator [Actinomycetes bacterium]
MNHAIPNTAIWPDLSTPTATESRRRKRGPRGRREDYSQAWAQASTKDNDPQDNSQGRNRSDTSAPNWDHPQPERPRGSRSGRRGRGDVKAAVLLLLAEKPRHGYEILTELAERSGGHWKASPGSIYPVLKNLTRKGLVRPEEEDGRRVFHLTETGTALVANDAAGWGTPWARRKPEPNPALKMLQDEAQRLTGAVRQVAQSPDQDLIQQATQTLVAARKAIFLALAEETGATASASPSDGDETTVGKPEPEDPGSAESDSRASAS